MTTLEDLRTECAGLLGRSPEYVAKQFHKLPPAKVLEREAFIVRRCEGRVVLDIGASGMLHEEIVRVASKCYGIDRDDSEGVVGINLDDVNSVLPHYPDVELVVCGEVIEHLGNPLQFLRKLRANYPCKIIITVPNAFTRAGQRFIRDHWIENVNLDHVAWYSPRTLKTLLERAGMTVSQWAWYRGEPGLAEGIIAVVEGQR